MSTDRLVALGEHISVHAAREPHAVVLTYLSEDGTERDYTAAELDSWSNRVARLLEVEGVGAGDRVGIGLRNSPEHVVAALGAWKLGAGVITMRWDVPRWERDRLLEVTQPKVVLAEQDEPGPPAPLLSIARAAALPDDPMPMSPPLRPMAIPTGGSTGASKAVVLPVPAAMPIGAAFGSNYATFGIGKVHRHLIMGPLYHGNPLLMLHAGMFDGQHIILMDRFDPARLVQAINAHQPEFMTIVPTMMRRLLDVPGIRDVDWSCFEMILHGTAPCPPDLKRAWIELVGPERLWETFASSELVGSIIVRGDEWLAHPGTIGRPSAGTELRILDEHGNDVPPDQVGEIFMRIVGTETPAFDYLGADKPKMITGGFVSVGDLGRFDADGFVYSADRSDDLIITGGANVVPAEVEAALIEHPDVADVAVIGLPDADWGKRVHAVVVPRVADREPSLDSLRAHAKSRLASYKVPKTFDFVAELPRSEMFKIRRSALVAERTH